MDLGLVNYTELNLTENNLSSNLTTYLTPSDHHGLVYSVGVSAIIGILLTALTIACVLGNSLVIFAVLAVHKLRTPSNYLIVSLAVSDWLVGMIVMPLSIIYELIGKWPFGPQVCSMWATFDVMLCTASILNLMMISIDRYLVITRPFRYSQQRTNKLMLIYMLIAWIVSLIISTTPMMVGWNTQLEDGACIINQEIGYQIYATLAAFYLPLIVMIGLYGQIFFISARITKAEAKNNPAFLDLGTAGHSPLHTMQNGRKSITVDTELVSLTENGQKQTANNNTISKSDPSQPMLNGHRNGKPRLTQNSDQLQFSMRKQSRRKSGGNGQAIQTLGMIMGLFTACWLPFFILAVVRSICGDSCNIPNQLSSLLTWLGYFNSCINPLIYARFNREFRTPFKEIICCRCQTINQSVRQTEYLYRYGR